MKILRLVNYLLTTTLVVAMLLACGGKEEQVADTNEADSLIDVAHKEHAYERLLELADTLQAAGKITDIQADYWRGYAYSRKRMMRLSEKYWKQAVNAEIHNKEGLKYYAKSANRLAGALLLKSEYEATMKVAVPALDKMRAANYRDNSDFGYLLTAVGCCQLMQGSAGDAAINFGKSMDLFRKVVEEEPTKANFTTAIVAVISITENFLQLNEYQDAFNWTLKFKELLDYYKELPNPDSNFVDKQQARLDIYHASALDGLGHHEEAKQVFNDALKSKYIQTNQGKLEAINYLLSAKRWDEAAQNFEVLDKQMQQYDATVSMDIIQHFLLPKYRANIGAHRIDAAMEVSRQVCDELDTAIIRMQRDEAMELTTIYNTQQKEKELSEQKANMVRQRYMAIIMALVLVILCFLFISYFRQQSAKRLASAYRSLGIANERNKETSRMKTSFIQQMSHEIRTPLNILSGFTQILTSPNIDIDEKTRSEINDKIIENTKRITELVNKMLELSDVNSKTIIERNDNTPVIQIAQGAVNTISASEEATIPISLKWGENIEQLTLQTNEQAATRALVLLLDNAERYTKKGSITLTLTKKEEYVLFIVEDTGIGVPPKEAEHIFEEFVQLNEYEVGTGIGLTVARSICRRLGGDIILDTTYTDGARFVILLPIN
ncbi:MAG: HAMP domain-containing histidine kinase [Prevotella sp.]|nr:HAMP domain-containing histidine kinase [Prevotella sp.]